MMKYIYYCIFCALFFMACDSSSMDSTPGGQSFDSSAYTTEKIPNSDLVYLSKLDADGNLLEEGYLKNGKQHGIWMSYNVETQHMTSLHSFDQGVFQGPQFEYNQRGQLVKRITYWNGVLNGLTIDYNNGRFEKEVMYKDGQVNGYIKEYSSRGKLFKYAEYKNNTLNGKVINYNEEGEVVLEYEYKDGEKISGGIVE